MRMYFAGVGAALTVCVIAASPPAVASTMIGPQDTSVDWAQEFCLTDCTSTPTGGTGISQIDLIMSPASLNATPSITFTGISPVFSDINETPSLADLTATTTLGADKSTIVFSSPDTADVFLTLNFSPLSTDTPFTFYWEQFTSTGQFITTNSSTHFK